MDRRQLIRSAACALAAPALSAACRPALAAGLTHLLVPFPAGGPSDLVARALVRGLAAAGRPEWVVENRPGAEGLIAARAALGTPDGAALLYVPASLVAVGQMAHPPVDLRTDFTPVASIGRLAFGLFVHPDLHVDSVEGLVAEARRRPGGIDFATSTHSELMAAHQFMRATGTSMTRVPYKGAAQALPDLLTGRVQVNFGPLAAALPHVRDRRLRLLATLLPERSPLAPDVPTIGQAGVPQVDVPTWQALFAPGRLAPVEADRLAQACRTALAQPTLRAELESRALQIDPRGPQDLLAAVKREHEEWARLIRDYRLEAA